MGGGAVSIWLWPHRFSITKVFVCQLAEQISSIKCEVRVDWDLDDDGRQKRWVRQPPFPEKVLWGCHVVVGGGVTLKCGVLPKRCYRAPCAGGLCFHYQLSSKLDVGLVHLVWNTCFVWIGLWFQGFGNQNSLLEINTVLQCMFETWSIFIEQCAWDFSIVEEHDCRGKGNPMSRDTGDGSQCHTSSARYCNTIREIFKF